MTERLRGTVIGCGFFAENHLNAWASMPDVELVAVCDLDAGQGRERGPEVRRRAALHRRRHHAARAASPTSSTSRPRSPRTGRWSSCRGRRRSRPSCRSRSGRPWPTARRWSRPAPTAARAADGARELPLPAALAHDPRADRPGPDRHAALRPDHLPHRPRHLRQAALPRDRGAVHHLRPRRARARHGALLLRRGRFDRLPDQAGEPEHQGRGQRHHAAAAQGRRRLGGRLLLRDADPARPVPRDAGRDRRRPGCDAPGAGLPPADRHPRRQGRGTASSTPTPLPWAERPWHVVQESVLRIEEHWVDCLRRGVEPETSGADNLKTFALVEAAYRSAASGETVHL